MAVRRRLARFNKYVSNPIQRMWAPYLPPYAVVEHVGRRSGTSFRTPVVAAADGEHVVIAMLYGEESDWVRNVLVADQATVVRRGRRIEVTSPRIVGSDDEMLGRLGHRYVRRIGRRVLVADVQAPTTGAVSDENAVS